MTWVHRTMIVPAAHVDVARLVASSLAGAGGTNMWITKLNATGAGTPTHYISAGYIEESFAALLIDANAAFQACQAANISVTLTELTNAVTASDVSEEDPSFAMERLGLRMIHDDLL